MLHSSIRFLIAGVVIAGIAIASMIVGRLPAAARGSRPSPDDAQKTVAALDTEYQAAVKINDASTMNRILADDFILVTGSGKTYNKADMVNDAKGAATVNERNDEDTQTVRVWGNTAVVTAKLWEKGTTSGRSFDHKSGSAIPICARPRDGNMSLASLRCRWPIPPLCQVLCPRLRRRARSATGNTISTSRSAPGNRTYRAACIL